MPPGGDRPPRDPAETLREVAASLVCDHAPVVMGLMAPDGTVLALEGALVDRLGYDRDAWVGHDLADLVRDLPILSLVRRALDGESVAETVLLNGRTWLVLARPVVAADGTPNGAVSVLTYADEAEVHRELTAKEALNEQFAALIQLSQDFIAIADLDGKVTFVNDAGRRMVGLSEDEETLGRPTDDYFTERGRDKSREIETAVRERGSWEGETFLRHIGTEESIPVSAKSFLVTPYADGAPHALATVQRDQRGRMRQDRAQVLRAPEQRAVGELGRLALTMPLTELMQESVELIHARYPTLVAGVLQRMPDGRAAEMVASSVPEWAPVVLELDDSSLTGRAIVRNEIVVSDDVVTDPQFPHQAATTRFSMRSAVSVPIPGGAHPWGAVGVSGVDPRHWTDDDVAFVDAVAATLGAAVLQLLPAYGGSWRTSCSTRRSTTR